MHLSINQFNVHFGNNVLRFFWSNLILNKWWIISTLLNFRWSPQYAEQGTRILILRDFFEYKSACRQPGGFLLNLKKSVRKTRQFYVISPHSLSYWRPARCERSTRQHLFSEQLRPLTVLHVVRTLKPREDKEIQIPVFGLVVVTYSSIWTAGEDNQDTKATGPGLLLFSVFPSVLFLWNRVEIIGFNRWEFAETLHKSCLSYLSLRRGTRMPMFLLHYPSSD